MIQKTDSDTTTKSNKRTRRTPEQIQELRESLHDICREACRLEPAARVEVFTPIERFFEEPDGTLTALLHGGNRQQALRAAVPPGQRAHLEPLLRASVGEFRQNYLWVTGRMTRDRRGYRLEAAEGLAWRVAGPPFPPH